MQPAQAVYHHGVANGKSLLRVFNQSMHLLQRHLFVSFVVQVQRSTATRIVAHNAVKDDHGSIFALLELLDKNFGLNRLAHQCDI